MSLHTHRKSCNPQGIRGAHGPVPNQPIAGPENPHGNTLGRDHENLLRRRNQARRQDRPEPIPAPRPDILRHSPDQPATGTPSNYHGPGPAEDPTLPVHMTGQNGLLDVPIPANTSQPFTPMLEGRAEEEKGTEAMDDGYEADDES